MAENIKKIDDPTTLSERVRQRREELEMTQADLARAIGLTPSSINLLEKEKRKSSKHLNQLARVLKTTPEWLIGSPGADKTPRAPRGLAEDPTLEILRRTLIQAHQPLKHAPLTSEQYADTIIDMYTTLRAAYWRDSQEGRIVPNL